MNNFNIQYPALVEQAYNLLISQGVKEVSKQDIYKKLVAEKMLDENGEPTQKAIEQGLVEPAITPIEVFKAKFPIFAPIDDKYFNVVNGEVLITAGGVSKACKIILAKTDAPDWQKEQARNLLAKIDKQ